MPVLAVGVAFLFGALVLSLLAIKRFNKRKFISITESLASRFEELGDKRNQDIARWNLENVDFIFSGRAKPKQYEL